MYFKASRSLEEYFLAGRSIKGWKAGFSLAATQFAAGTPLLVTGLIATGGLFMLWRLWIYGLGFLMIGFLLGRSWRRAGVLWLRLLSMSMLSTFVIILVTIFTRSEKEDILKEFYIKTDPPGFWRKTARAAGTISNDPLKKFMNGMYLTLTVSIPLYFLLVAC